MQISSTACTPKVNFDEEEGVLEIKGRSFPENAKEFYIPVLEWLNDFFERVNGTIVYRINLEYFNTASSKFILETLHVCERMFLDKNIDVTVQWLYVLGDDDMKDAGKEFEQIVKVPFTYVELTAR